MNASTRRIAPIPEPAGAKQARVAAQTPAAARASRPSANRPDIDHTPAMPSLGAEAWPWYVVSPVAPANAAEGADAASAVWPLATELYRAARRRQAAFLGDMIAAAMRAAGDGVRKALAGYRSYRRARATHEALQSLDDRTLRDLGLARDEIRSVAAEMAGEAERSRRLARRTYPVRPSLFGLLFGP